MRAREGSWMCNCISLLLLGPPDDQSSCCLSRRARDWSLAWADLLGIGGDGTDVAAAVVRLWWIGTSRYAVYVLGLFVGTDVRRPTWRRGY